MLLDNYSEHIEETTIRYCLGRHEHVLTYVCRKACLDRRTDIDSAAHQSGMICVITSSIGFYLRDPRSSSLRRCFLLPGRSYGQSDIVIAPTEYSEVQIFESIPFFWTMEPAKLN